MGTLCDTATAQRQVSGVIGAPPKKSGPREPKGATSPKRQGNVELTGRPKRVPIFPPLPSRGEKQQLHLSL